MFQESTVSTPAVKFQDIWLYQQSNKQSKAADCQIARIYLLFILLSFYHHFVFGSKRKIFPALELVPLAIGIMKRRMDVAPPRTEPQRFSDRKQHRS